jgi:hypothetical protein
MALFYTSGILANTAIGGSLIALLDAGSQGNQDLQHNNFIRFLQIARALDVTILPLVWDPALEALGTDGATGRVNQSHLNAGLSFAFKRFNPRVTTPGTSEEAYRQVQYNAMITEITVLSRRDIRRHPNIVTFIGICFELSPVCDDVWPVLVFSKADLGDIYTFISDHTALDVSSLAAICGEVAKGIYIMHQCGKHGRHWKPRSPPACTLCFLT